MRSKRQDVRDSVGGEGGSVSRTAARRPHLWPALSTARIRRRSCPRQTSSSALTPHSRSRLVLPSRHVLSTTWITLPRSALHLSCPCLPAARPAPPCLLLVLTLPVPPHLLLVPACPSWASHYSRPVPPLSVACLVPPVPPAARPARPRTSPLAAYPDLPLPGRPPIPSPPSPLRRLSRPAPSHLLFVPPFVHHGVPCPHPTTTCSVPPYPSQLRPAHRPDCSAPPRQPLVPPRPCAIPPVMSPILSFLPT